MSKRLPIEEVTMYKVSPRWGKGPYRVVKVKCAKKGKSLLIPARGNRYTWPKDLHETPEAAVKERIAEERKERDAQAEYLKNYDETIKQLEGLL